MQSNEYEMKLGVRKRMLLIDLNFTKKVSNVKLTVLSKKNLVYKDPDTFEGVLYLNNTFSTLSFNVDVKPNKELFEGMETTADAVGTVAAVAGSFGVGVALVGSFFQLPAMSYLVRFIVLFKILDRLKLINIYFGPILTVFLDKVGNILNMRSKTNQNAGIRYYTRTRGKLTYYRIHNLAFYRMPMKYAIYMVKLFN